MSGSSTGTDLYTGGVLAVVAKDRINVLRHLRVFSCFADDHPGPKDIGWEKVFLFAGYHTAVTADTPF